MTDQPAQRIDLRSDTVTKPSEAMRRAIYEAEVGDDVYGEDPTVNRLQERVAEIVGKQAALFVPSGSMANQIALKISTQPGDEVLAGQDAHTWLFESGAAAAVAGVQVSLLPGDGRFDAAAVERAFKVDNHHHSPTKLVTVENTHNLAGGVLWDHAVLRDVLTCARKLGLATHLDGARLWNAAVATGKSERELCDGFDTVAVCLSKGLGAPTGSVICGSRELIHKAHRIRKMLGGAMRQVGFLAAAGLHAIEHNRARLAIDHENAAFLARRLSDVPGMSVNLDTVHTNIVMVDVAPDAGDANDLARRASERGLLFNAFSPRRLRLVTHYDVDREGCSRAVDLLAELLSQSQSATP